MRCVDCRLDASVMLAVEAGASFTPRSTTRRETTHADQSASPDLGEPNKRHRVPMSPYMIRRGEGL